MIEKFKEKKSNEFCKELLDSLSIKDLLNKKNDIHSEKNNSNNNFKLVNKDNINMEEDNLKNDENENIYEEIRDFISFDKNINENNKSKKISNNNNNKNYNFYKFDYFGEQKYYMKDYINIYKYNNIPDNIKTTEQCSSERLCDLFENYPPLLEKNPCDYYECRANIGGLRKNLIKNNSYRKQQYQENNLFIFNKKYEVNSLLLKPQFQPSFPSFYLQKTFPFSYNNQSYLFSYNNSNYSPFFSSRNSVFDNCNQFNYASNINDLPALLKTIPNKNNRFLNNFNFQNSLLNNKIKNQHQFKYNNSFNSTSEGQNISQDKKQKTKLRKKLFIRNNKLVYVINEKHTDTKDVIYLDEDSESNNNDDKNEKINVLERIKEKLAEGRKQRSSKFRGVSKNGKNWQVLIMIKQKKRYIGNFSNEEEAARIYDKIAIQFHGSKAKTNFQYSEDEINSIIALPKLQKLSNLF